MDDGFNEFLHVPARLTIVALLAPSSWTEFGFLRDAVPPQVIPRCPSTFLRLWPRATSRSAKSSTRADAAL